MGCKLSISVVHPSKSPKNKTIKEIPVSPIIDSNVKKQVAPDDDSYETIELDTPPDSARTTSSLDIYQYV